jgi:catechol-2,3-dioxygenase
MKKPPVRFQRASFVAQDLDRALQFQRDILGFTVENVQDSPAESCSCAVFEFDRRTAPYFALLSAPGSIKPPGASPGR